MHGVENAIFANLCMIEDRYYESGIVGIEGNQIEIRI